MKNLLAELMKILICLGLFRICPEERNCYSATTKQGELAPIQIKQKTMTTEIYFAWESTLALNYK